MPDSLGNPEGKQKLRTVSFKGKCKLSRRMLMCILIQLCSYFFVAHWSICLNCLYFWTGLSLHPFSTITTDNREYIVCENYNLYKRDAVVYVVCMRELLHPSDTCSRHALLPATKWNSAGTEKLQSLYQNTLRVSKGVMEVFCFFFTFIFFNLSFIL